MKLYKQEKLVEKLLQFRLKKQGFNLLKVECYNRFDGDHTMCRVEVFRGGKGINNRVMKYEAYLDESYVLNVENYLKKLLEQ